MNRTGVITIGIILLCLVGAAFYTFVHLETRDARDSEARKTLGGENTAAEYTDVTGAEFDFVQYEGRVRVVNVWASWTPFSKRELQDLATLSTEYSKEKVVVIAINRNESKERAAAFIDTLPETGEVVFVQDMNDSFYERIGGRAMPETIFFDADGNIVAHTRGPITLTEMRTYTEEAIAASNE